jgi:hypothetical protein
MIVLTAYALIKYRKCSYDRFNLLVFGLFLVSFVIRFSGYLIQDYFEINTVFSNILVGNLMPLGFALLMCCLYLYIFEVEKKRIGLVYSQNEKLEMNALRNCKIQKWTTIVSVLMQYLLSAIANINSMYYDKINKFLTNDQVRDINIAISALKVITDVFIYFILIRAVKVINGKYLQRNRST